MRWFDIYLIDRQGNKASTLDSWIASKIKFKKNQYLDLCQGQNWAFSLLITVLMAYTRRFFKATKPH